MYISISLHFHPNSALFKIKEIFSTSHSFYWTHEGIRMFANISIYVIIQQYKKSEGNEMNGSRICCLHKFLYWLKENWNYIIFTSKKSVIFCAERRQWMCVLYGYMVYHER